MIVMLIIFSLNYFKIAKWNMFGCKDKEPCDLNKRYNKNYIQCVIVHGRRVRKTALINEFCKGKP